MRNCRLRTLLAPLAALTALAAGLPTTAAAAQPTIPPTSGPPATPPAQICGNASILDGPATQPPGSVRVDPGMNLHNLTVAHPPGTTFWLSPGTHRLDQNEFGQVIPRDNNVYIGAPGAILDGNRVNRYAFTQQAKGVVIRHLTIQNFVSPNGESVVNHDGGDSWTIENNTIRNNKAAGLELGSNTVVRYNCLAYNGQYGFSTSKPSGVVNVLLDHNEIGHNAADDIEMSDPACGCSGGGKFWGVHGAIVTNNWVHDNKAQGLFADTNAVGFRIEGNYINENLSEGIVYETSYNAYIHNNTLKRNGLRKGGIFAARKDGFPIAAIYIQESGGDARVYNGVYSTLEISGNVLEDNWGGVVLWENADRFCNTAGNTADGYCPIAGQGTVETCKQGTIEQKPYYDDCRWKTQNVLVKDNDFRIDKTALNCSNNCGQQGLFSNPGENPSWSPYKGNVIQEAITYHQNNRFQTNRYVGPWQFDAYAIGNVVDFATWQNKYGQDLDSIYNGSSSAPNALNADTATLEGSIGVWVPWFSTSLSRSSAQAHGGSHSLKVDITAPHGWGVTQSNWPGFPATAGNKQIGFWGRSGAGTGLSATMSVHWRDAGGAALRTDKVTLALGASWAQASAVVTAPTGTARVAVDFSNSSGVAGNFFYLDDITVTDSAVAPPPPPPPPPPGNALDADTSTLEGSIGAWVPWFSSTVSRSSAQAHGGTQSLKVDITAAHGWGVTQSNWPGFTATSGTKTISFWGRGGTGSGLSATMSVHWRDTAGNTLRTDVLTLPLGPSWAQATASVTAPSGTARVGVDFSNSSGVAGNSLYLDDIAVTNSSGSPPPPPPPNALDADTSTLEGGLGKWVPWFSSNISSSTAQAHSGSRSLRVDITAPHGWGVTQSNWPGFAAAPGPYTIAFWGKAGSGSGLSATMHVSWRKADGGVLRTDVVTLPLTASWAQATANVTAPAGTARVGVDFTNPSGQAGNVVYIDDVVVSP